MDEHENIGLKRSCNFNSHKLQSDMVWTKLQQLLDQADPIIFPSLREKLYCNNCINY